MRAQPNALVFEGIAAREAEITIKPNVVLIDIQGVFKGIVHGLGAIEFAPARRLLTRIVSSDDPMMGAGE